MAVTSTSTIFAEILSVTRSSMGIELNFFGYTACLPLFQSKGNNFLIFRCGGGGATDRCFTMLLLDLLGDDLVGTISVWQVMLRSLLSNMLTSTSYNQCLTFLSKDAVWKFVFLAVHEGLLLLTLHFFRSSFIWVILQNRLAVKGWTHQVMLRLPRYIYNWVLFGWSGYAQIAGTLMWTMIREAKHQVF